LVLWWVAGAARPIALIELRAEDTTRLIAMLPTRDTIAIEREKSKQDRLENLFMAPFWSVATVLAWIAFRDVAWLEDSVRTARLYASPALRESDPAGSLTRALQWGRIAAFRDGAPLQRDSWARAVRSWPTVFFHREEVLKIWPPGRRSLTVRAETDCRR
jgi:hypothetical protein